MKELLKKIDKNMDGTLKHQQQHNAIIDAKTTKNHQNVNFFSMLKQLK